MHDASTPTVSHPPSWPYDGGGAYIRYDPLTADMCKKGGWQTFQPLFKNQGDCVSFVVTGRNEPAGS